MDEQLTKSKEKSIETLIEEWMNMFNDISFSIERIMKVSVPAGSSSPDKRTSEGVCGIVIPIKGEAIYEVEDVEYRLASGKILHAGYSMKLKKRVTSDVPWEFILIHYRLESYSSLKYEHFCLDINEQYRYQIIEIVEELEKYASSQTVLDSLYAKSTFYHLIAKIFELSLERKVELTNNTILSIAAYIKKNIQTPFTITQLAAMCNLDEVQFSYIFKKEMDMSVKQYIQMCRIERAKVLLETTELPIYEISYEIGLSDALYFSRVFKKYTGLAPLDYRNKNLSI